LLRRWFSIRSERKLEAQLIDITLIILAFKLLTIPYP
jgi:hypothetical protein